MSNLERLSVLVEGAEGSGKWDDQLDEDIGGFLALQLLDISSLGKLRKFVKAHQDQKHKEGEFEVKTFEGNLGAILKTLQPALNAFTKATALAKKGGSEDYETVLKYMAEAINSTHGVMRKLGVKS